MITLLIVDDSEIDRAVLKNILATYYNVVEADSGYTALDILNNSTFRIDGMMLDISMPGIDGFSVLSLLDRSKHMGMQILLISAEAQKNNIVKAVSYGAAGFIKKPYDATLVLNKLKSLFSKKTEVVAPPVFANGSSVSDNELRATASYAERLRRIYLSYLKSEKKNDALYDYVSEVVHIMLDTYFRTKSLRDLSPEAIEIIAQAAYFYDIGRIVVRNEKFKVYSQTEIDQGIPESHTIVGADLVSVNQSQNVSYFVKVCSDMCMHHHERYDGRGMPQGLKNSINNIYTQMCSISVDFCTHFFCENSKHDLNQFNYTMNLLLEDKDAYRPDVIEILKNSQNEILSHFSKR